MDTAFRVVTTYDQWLRDRMHEGFDFVLNQPVLMERYQRVMRTSREPFEKMMRIGPTVDEEYEGHPPGP